MCDNATAQVLAFSTAANGGQDPANKARIPPRARKLVAGVKSIIAAA
jgi:hypothetical protein